MWLPSYIYWMELVYKLSEFLIFKNYSSKLHLLIIGHLFQTNHFAAFFFLFDFSLSLTPCYKAPSAPSPFLCYHTPTFLDALYKWSVFSASSSDDLPALLQPSTFPASTARTHSSRSPQHFIRDIPWPWFTCDRSPDITHSQGTIARRPVTLHAFIGFSYFLKTHHYFCSIAGSLKRQEAYFGAPEIMLCSLFRKKLWV